jgi:hypothetical protein
MNILRLFRLFLGLIVLSGYWVSGYTQTSSKTKGYFQQRVDHTINVRLDDQQHVLRGRTQMVYHHRGAQPLDTLYFHLWPNAFSSCKSHWCQQQIENRNTDFLDEPKTKRGAIDSLSFTVNGQSVAHSAWQEMPDVAFLVLPTPLQPGQQITIETPFRVKIPASFSRLGHVNQQYQLTQWYPKPAVYDANGWHPLPYLDQGEFYSEFGTFDVTIQLPKNYVVGATGVLQNNPEEQRFIAQREQTSRALLAGDSSSGRKIDKTTVAYKPFKYPYPDVEYKTLRFVQDSVHDFAWFCDKDYYILTDSAQLPRSGRWVKTVALFNHKDRRFWKKATEYINQALWSYSNQLGDYPYSHCTAVDGALSAGAGMEYPMITVVGSGGSAESLRRVIIHEVGHNWFYGILATNERTYPWLDEGFNTYLEYRTLDSLNTLTTTAKRPSITAGFVGINLDLLGIKDSDDLICLSQNYVQGNGRVEPLEYPADKYWSTNYGVIVYIKSVAALRMLESYLTRPRFDAALRAYYEQWKFRHPQPEDVQQAFEQSTGQDLSWFFKRYVHTRETPDFQLLSAQEKNSSELMVRIRQVGHDTLPVCIQVLGRAGDTLASTWTQPFSGVIERVISVPPSGEWQRVEVNPGPLIPEQLTGNNVWFRRVLFPRLEPLKLNLVGVNTPMHKRTLSVLPAVAFNRADQVAVGFLAYYQFFPKKKFEAHLMPMYSFGLRTLAGSTGFKYRFLNRSTGFLPDFRSSFFLKTYVLGSATSWWLGRTGWLTWVRLPTPMVRTFRVRRGSRRSTSKPSGEPNGGTCVCRLSSWPKPASNPLTPWFA